MEILEEIQFNDLFYITLIVKIFQKYNETKKSEDIKIVFQYLRNVLRKKNLIPNKELIDILAKFNNNGLIIYEEKNLIEIQDNNLKNNFTIYCKYNFTYGGIISVDKMLKRNILKSFENFFLILPISAKKNFVPKIIMKLFNNIEMYESKFYSFPYLLNNSMIMLKKILLDNLELKTINKLLLICLILNVIQYGEFISNANTKIPKKIIPINYFIETVFKLHSKDNDFDNIINDENDINVKPEYYNSS